MALNPQLQAEQLLRLATESPVEGEARNAAMAACRLIVKHSLLNAAKGAPRPSGGTRTPPRPPPPRWEDFYTPRPAATHFFVQDRQGMQWKVHPAPIQGWCAGCDQPWMGEAQVMTRKGKGMFHERCWQSRFVDPAPTRRPAPPSPKETVVDREGNPWSVYEANTATVCCGCVTPIHPGTRRYSRDGVVFHEPCWRTRHADVPSSPITDEELDSLFNQT